MVFMSYSSRDRESVVRPLVGRLRALGVSCWIDTDEVRIGDSIQGKIEQALKDADAGVVVISRAYLDGPWTMGELRALLAARFDFNLPVLPIRHGITHAELARAVPLLADTHSVSSTSGSHFIAQVVADVVSARGASAQPGGVVNAIVLRAQQARVSTAPIRLATHLLAPVTVAMAWAGAFTPYGLGSPGPWPDIAVMAPTVGVFLVSRSSVRWRPVSGRWSSQPSIAAFSGHIVLLLSLLACIYFLMLYRTGGMLPASNDVTIWSLAAIAGASSSWLEWTLLQTFSSERDASALMAEFQYRVASCVGVSLVSGLTIASQGDSTGLEEAQILLMCTASATSIGLLTWFMVLPSGRWFKYWQFGTMGTWRSPTLSGVSAVVSGLAVGGATTFVAVAAVLGWLWFPGRPEMYVIFSSAAIVGMAVRLLIWWRVAVTGRYGRQASPHRMHLYSGVIAATGMWLAVNLHLPISWCLFSFLWGGGGGGLPIYWTVGELSPRPFWTGVKFGRAIGGCVVVASLVLCDREPEILRHLSIYSTVVVIACSLWFLPTRRAYL